MRINILGRPALRLIAASFLLTMTVDCFEEPSSSGSGCDGSGAGGIFGGGGPIGGSGPTWVPAGFVPSAAAVAGNTQGKVFVVGSAGFIASLESDGPHVVTDPPALQDLNDVWVGPNSVYAVGRDGGAVRFNGSAWESIPVGGDPYLVAVSGVSDDEVFAVGYNGTVSHWVGDSWTTTTLGMRMSAVWAASASDVFAAGVAFDGITPTIYHYTSSTWLPMQSIAPNFINDIWGTSATDVYAVGGRTKSSGGVVRVIFHYDGVEWTPANIASSTDLNGSGFSRVWGASSTDVYVLGYAYPLVHFNGNTWTKINIGSDAYVDIGGTNATNIYMVRHSASQSNDGLHYNGVSWGPEPFYESPRFTAVWTDSVTFAVGREGAILRMGEYGAGSQHMDSGTTNDLLGVWGNGRTDAFAVGTAGTIVHYDGSGWVTQESNVSTTLRDVWAVSKDKAFAVGDAGTILQYANGAWAPMASNVLTALHSVWGSSLQNIYAVGEQGTVLRFDGVTWTTIDAGVTKDLHGVWVEPGVINRVIVVGNEGTFRTHDPNGWATVKATSYGDLSAVWGNGFNDVHVSSRSRLIIHFNGIAVDRVWYGPQIGQGTGPVINVHGTGKNVLAVDENNGLLQFWDF